MKTAPSEELQGVAEEIVDVDVDENRIIGDPNAPNKDTNTIVKVVVTGEHVTTPSNIKEKSGDQYNCHSSYGRRRDYS